MCGICKNKKARDMDIQIVKFFVSHGNFPAFMKVDEQMDEAAQNLSNRLRGMQSGLVNTFIDAIADGIPGSDADRMQIIERITGGVFEDMMGAVADGALEGANIGRFLTFDDLQEQGMDIDFTEFDESVADDLRNRAYEFSEDTFSRIQGDFNETLASGYEDGLGIEEIADNLQGDFDNLENHRLELIARTEVQGGQNDGAHRTMIEAGVGYNQWLTVGDERVREGPEADHVILHGEVVEVGEAFSNGLIYPGDRSGAIEDWINCRCRKRPYIPRPDEEIATTPYYP